MTDFDRALSATLVRAAGDDVHVEGLLDGARRAGTRYRRRRVGLLTGAGLAAGATAVLVTMTVLGPNGGPASAPQYGSSVGPAASASPSRPSALATWPTPPAATATTRLPLRLSLARAPFPLTAVQYQLLVDERQENLYVDGTGTDGPRRVTVRLGATTTDFEPLDGATRTVEVAGRPATLATVDGRGRTGSVLRWRTADGWWLQVVGDGDEADTLRIAASVRTDRTFRCVVPYRLAGLPADLKPGSCGMSFTADGVPMTMLGVSDGRFHVLIDTSDKGSLGGATGQVDGRPAREEQHPGDGGQMIMELAVEQADGGVVSLTASGRYEVARVRGIRAGMVWIGGTDPTTWPTDPLGGA